MIGETKLLDLNKDVLKNYDKDTIELQIYDSPGGKERKTGKLILRLNMRNKDDHATDESGEAETSENAGSRID